MARVETYVSDEALLWFALAREQSEDASERDMAIELAVAISAFFADWISPLTVSVRVESCDPNRYYFEDSKHPPAQEAWFLRRRDLDSRLFIRHSWNNAREQIVGKIEAADLLGVVKEALSQPPPLPNLEVALAEVIVKASSVLLPEDVELVCNDGYKQVEPIFVREGKRLAAQGPDYNFYGAPVALRASNLHGRTEIVVQFCWDFWLKHPAGLAQVHEAVARVLGRGQGWQLSEGNLPPLGSR